jgi:hypothetical protein
MWCQRSMAQCPRIQSSSTPVQAWGGRELVTAYTVTMRQRRLCRGGPGG